MSADDDIIKDGTFTRIPPFSRLPVTNRLIDFFATSKPGEEFTYDEISREAGCSPDAWRGVMGTVEKTLLDRYHIRLKCMRGIGYRHANDDDVVNEVKERGNKAHRQWVRGAREFRDGVKDHSRLSAEQQRIGIMTNTMASLSSPKTTRVLASARVENSKLDTGSFLDMMRKKLTDG